jgi:GTP cyclohydrolase I
MMLNLTWNDVRQRAIKVAGEIKSTARKGLIPEGEDGSTYVYGVPNGGIFAAQLVCNHLPWPGYSLTEHSSAAHIFIDDLIDSGKTFAEYGVKHDGIPFFPLFNKFEEGIKDWISFPWERMKKEDGPHDNIRRIIQYIGDKPEREGLKETPDRVVRSYAELYRGYKQKPEDIFKTFDDPVDEMVVLKNIEFMSSCEHHMLPFYGKASIAYLPDGKVIGLSKLARLLEVYCRRLQIQERLTTQITTVLDEHLKPKGSACIIEARHLCMCARGVNKQHSTMITSSLTGAFRLPEVRSEFFYLAKS